MPDEFDESYGHPELLPNELKGLREIGCDQCGHEMQILEQYIYLKNAFFLGKLMKTIPQNLLNILEQDLLNLL